MEDQGSVLTKSRGFSLHTDIVCSGAFSGCSEDGLWISFNAEILAF
jgi:hypothetical protein